jgi:hypothetical protein
VGLTKTGRGKGALLFWGAWAALALAGVAGLAVGGLLDWRMLQSRLDRLAADGKSPFDRAVFMEIMIRLRLAALAMLALAALALATRERVIASLGALAHDARRLRPRRAAASLRDFARREDVLHWLTLGTLVAVGLALRVAFLGQPMRYDEAYSWLRLASKPLPIALSYYSAPNNHLFHTFLMSLCGKAFGSAPWALRLPVLMAGTLLIPATYAAFRAHAGRDAGLLAAALTAPWPCLIDYSTNGRGYIMIALFFMALVALAGRLADRPTPLAWLGWAGASALGLWTVPVMLYPWGSATLWLAAAFAWDRRVAPSICLAPPAIAVAKGPGKKGLDTNGATCCPLATLLFPIRFLSLFFPASGVKQILAPDERRRRLTALLGASVATGVATFFLYVPVLIVSGPRRLFANDYVRSVGLSGLVGGCAPMARQVGAEWARGMPPVLAALLLLGLVGGLAPGAWRRRRPSWPVATAAWCVALLLAKRNWGYARVWLFLLPLAIGVASVGWAAALRWASRGRPPHWAVPALALAACAWIAVGVVTRRAPLTLDANGRLVDARQAALLLRGVIDPQDAVACWFEDAIPLEYYCVRLGMPVRPLYRPLAEGRRVWLVIDKDRAESARNVARQIAPVAALFGPPRPIAEDAQWRVERMDRLASPGPAQ